MTDSLFQTQPQTEVPASNGNGASPEAKRSLRELADGEAFELVFCVRERELRQKRDGEDFLKIVLADSTGSVPAICWEQAKELFDISVPGSAVRVSGRFSVHARYGRQIKISSIETAPEGSYDPADLAEGPPIPAERLEGDLRELIGTIQDTSLQQLLERFFGDGTEAWERFRAAPAAKFYHQAYVGGLLEHTLSVAQAVSAASAYFPGIDRDVAVTGALLHDIGKLEAYNDEPMAIDLTDKGRLLGEIPLGYYKVRREIEEIDGFDPDTAQAVLHIILSHHGSLEHGSPVVPCTREATLVHTMDNLGGKLGSFDRLERELADGEAWSRFDRGLSASAYFGSRAA